MRYNRIKLGILLSLLLVYILAVPGMASAAQLNAQITRIYGPTRIETAIRVSQTGWQHADTVLLARADDFSDSLVAIPLSHKLDAPILLTYSSLDPPVLNEIKRLGAKHIIFLGGDGVLGNTITQPLERAGLTWERIGGTDRYATAAMIADRLGPNGQAILVSGENFPDALAIGPYAGITETPILLTTFRAIPQVTHAELNKLLPNANANGGEGTPQTIVVGGEGVIPSATLQGVPGVNRIAGNDRYETAAKVYWFASHQLSLRVSNQRTQALLVSGENYPDALVAGALAAKEDVPLFMTAKTSLPAVVYFAMSNLANTNLKITILGGSSVVSNTVEDTVSGTTRLLSGLTVVIDPGHGGRDTGAIGATGTYEKNNTLPVGLDLANLLRAAGAKVILTRTSDTLPTGSNSSTLSDLKARVSIANTAKADIFVSIHNNAYSNPQVGGTTTYYCSYNPQVSASKQLALDVQSQAIKQLGLADRGIRDANFYVIRHTNMPAVLIELGFISNPAEEKLLGSADFQEKAAFGIYRGILMFKGA